MSTLPLSRTAILGACAALAVLVAGCGGSSSGGNQSVKTGGVNAAAAAKVPAALKSAGTIKVASDASYPPDEFFGSDNKTVQGMDVDLGRAIGQDLGLTFGRANLFNRQAVGSVNLEMWSQTPIWKDPKRCVGNLAAAQTGTLTDPVISEAGRTFLADLLTRLTDAQIRDLFTVARFADKPVNGGAGRTTVDAWVGAFKHKRDEITSVTCPS